MTLGRARIARAALVSLALWLTPFSAQAASSPEQVLLQSAAAGKSADWKNYAAFMHPEALAAARRLFVPIAKADPSGKAAQTFFDVKDAAELDALADAEIYARLFSGLARAMPAFAQAMATSEMAVIGSVAEPPDRVHVVYRLKASAYAIGIEKVSSATLKKHGSEWRLMLSASIEGLAARLSQMTRP